MQSLKKRKRQILYFVILTLPLYLLIFLLVIATLISLKKSELNTNYFFDSIVKVFKKNSLTMLIWTIILIFVYIILILIFSLFYKSRNLYVRTARTTEHGGAHWIVDEEKQLNLIISTNTFNKIYPISKTNTGQPGWVVRVKKTKNLPIYNTRSQTQALCLGTTGSGKTQKIIIPSAFYNANLGFDKQPCMVFTDPKGELCENLGKMLTKKGYEVLILNMREPKYSSGWNPLNMAYKYYYDAVTFYKLNVITYSFKKFIEIKPKLANLICFTHEKIDCASCSAKVNELKNCNEVFVLKNKFWLFNKTNLNKIVNSSILELKSAAYEEVEDLISCLFITPKNDNPVWVLNAGRMTAGVIYALLELLDDDVNALPVEKFNLTTVAVTLADQKKLISWFQKLGKFKPNSKAYITAAQIINSAEVTRQGVFSNIAPSLKIFEDLAIQNITCRNDVDLFKFTEKPKALFLIIPDEKTNRHILGSLFVSQLYKASVFIANSCGGALPRVIQFYLDEFGNMPVIPNFDSFITVARSRKMFFLLVLQDFKQLFEKYGSEKAVTIKNNCNLNIYIQTNDHETAEAYSKMIGDYTIISTTRNRGTKLEENRGGSTSQSGIPLIKASDLMRLKDPYGIVIYAKENPAKVYMEYAYNFSCYKLGREKYNIKEKVSVIDFYSNYFLDITDYNFEINKYGSLEN